MVLAGTCLVGNLERIKESYMKKECNKNICSAILSLYAQTWLYQIIAICIFATARISFLIMNTEAGEISENIGCLPLFAWNAWRFDAQSITYISLPIIVASLVAAFFKSNRAVDNVARFARYYYATMLPLLSLLVIAEFYFHDNFATRYNVVFFDFFDEGPLGLLKTMFEDYPAIPMLLFIIGIGLIVGYIGKYIMRKRITVRSTGIACAIAMPILVAGMTFIFMRGSVTTYTLQVEAFMVSPSDNINAAVPNALYMLKKAYKERSNSFKLKNDAAILKEKGFTSIEEAIYAASLQPSNMNTGNEVENALFRITEKNDSVLLQRPNILLIMNESWSNFLLYFDKDKELDLLCSLRPHLEEDIVLQNFQSVRNGTIYTLESVTLAMPYLHFYQSKYRYNALETSIASPFKASGYSTRFITGMDPTWENLNEALKVQQFDRIDGRQQVMHSIKGSTTSSIGVYDEFLYSYIFNEMNSVSESGKPQFIMALTTTNHPPFTYPENINLPPLTDDWYNSKFITGSRNVKEKYGIGAQYANQCLGDFMDMFKKSPLAKNTIVVVTGDHNVRSILDYENVPKEYRHSVPLYIYLPEQYKPLDEDIERIEKRYGCHYDLLPTIARFAFVNGTKYLNIGNDLLDMEQSDSCYFSYNEKMILAPDETEKTKFERIMDARLTLLKLYYQGIFRAGT